MQQPIETPVDMQALEADLIAQGYDLEELERDNPYNQWMYEDE